VSATAVAGAAPVGRAGGAVVPPASGITTRKLVAFIAMVFGMFMALLDIQIVSASLSEIQAGLAASADEISWVQTSYLIAEVVMIPLSGLLTRALSTRWLFALSAGGFTLASIACGLSTSIDEMIVFRAIQGFVGGAMIPAVFAAAFTAFPPKSRALISPVIGLIATLAPTIGPTIGGLLTNATSWHWLFFVNVIPGIAVTIAALSLIDFDRPNLKILQRFDWWGLIAMALFLCSLEFVLEEGPSNDWFDDNWIAIFAVIAAGGAVGFFWRMLTAVQPIVDLSAFKDRNFSSGSLLSFVLGIGLYGLTYLYPLYLGRVRGYDSLMIGETMFVSGAAMFLTAPIVGRLAQRFDLRIVMAVGFLGFAYSTWMLTSMTTDWDFNELLLPQVFRGVSLMLCIVPINNVALGTLPREALAGASGLYNLMRNLGGAVGLAAINTVINNRLDLHLARLHELVTAGNVAAGQWLDQLGHAFSGLADPDAAALKQLALMVRGQATVMAFADVFFVLTLIFLGILPLLLILRRPAAPAGGGGGH
jgi:DHA2 family multidrug resistance protein